MLLGIFSLLIIIAVVAFLGFGLALFLSSKKTAKQQPSVEAQVRDAISKARRIKFKAQADINRLTMWANDAIGLTYGKFISDIPADELLNNYETIKSQYADKVDPKEFEKTDRIVNGYLSQINIKKAEMEFAGKTEEKYTQLLEELKKSGLSKKRYDRLERHEKKLESMQDDVSASKQLIEQNLSYDMIKNDVDQQLAYLEALQQLQDKYDTQSFVMNADVYKQEMENIINN